MNSHDLLMLALGVYLGIALMAVLHLGAEILDVRRERKAAAKAGGAR